MKVNQLKAGVVLSYLSMGLSSVIQLAYTPVMLRLLGQSEYGLYSLVNSVVSYLGLLTFGIGGAYLRFYSRERAGGDEKEVARLNGMFLLVFSAIGAIALAAGLVLSGNAGLVFGDKLTAAELDRAGLLVVLLSVNLAVSIPAGVFSSYITAHEQYIFQRVLGIASSVLNPFLTLPLLLMGYGSFALVVVSLTLALVTTAINIGFALRKLHMRFCFQGIHWGVLKEIYVFSAFLFLNQIIDQVNWSIDSIILGHVWGTAVVAVYGLASRMNGIYLGFSTTISSVFAPRNNRIVAEERDVDSQLLDLMVRVGRIQGLLLLLLLMGLALLGQPFLQWMGGDPSYLGSYPVMLLLIIPVTIPLVQNLGLEIQRAKNKHQFRSLVYAGMAGVNVLISLALARPFGAVGVAFGTAVSLVVANGFVMNWYYHRHLGLDMVAFWKGLSSLARGAVLPAAYCLICGLTLDLFQPLWFFAAGAGLVAVYALSMWRWGMNEGEKDLVRRPLAKLFKKEFSHDRIAGQK